MFRITTGASVAVLVALAATVLVLVAPASAAAPSRVGFGFNASSIAGFDGGGKVFLTGGGGFDVSGDFVHSGGGFHCLETVSKGLLSGCLQGQGVRWDTEKVLASTGFKCTGAAAEALKNASTDEHHVVLQADFYRAGDANDESFQANIIVSDQDLDAVMPGDQNVWIQSVGCGTANVSFSSQAS